MNKQIAQLQEFSKSRDENSQHAKKHSSSVVVSLQSKLANMSKSFKQVLEIRTGTLAVGNDDMNHTPIRRLAIGYIHTTVFSQVQVLLPAGRNCKQRFFDGFRLLRG